MQAPKYIIDHVFPGPWITALVNNIENLGFTCVPRFPVESSKLVLTTFSAKAKPIDQYLSQLHGQHWAYTIGFETPELKTADLVTRVTRLDYNVTPELGQQLDAVLEGTYMPIARDYMGTSSVVVRQLGVLRALPAQLSDAELEAILPDATPAIRKKLGKRVQGSQPEHRDDEYGTRPRAMLLVVAIDRAITCENGATLFRPGSHKSPHETKYSTTTDKQLVPCELRANDAVMWDMRVFHKGSANKTSSDRLAFYAEFIVQDFVHDVGNCFAKAKPLPLG